MVRVVGLPPRQVAPVPAVPGQQPLSKRGRRSGGGGTGRSATAPRLLVAIATWRCASAAADSTAAFGAHLVYFPSDTAVKIYTRTGDTGETSLFDGIRVQQRRRPGRGLRRGRRAQRLARVGACSAPSRSSATSTPRSRSSSATCSRSARSSPIRREDSPRACEGGHRRTTEVARLEQLIDRSRTSLPPLPHFILAGGAPAGAALHVARTVCRRAERRIVALHPAAESRAASSTSTACRICCSCWRAWSIIERACPRDGVVKDGPVFDRVEDGPRQLLRDAFADGATFDEQSCRETVSMATSQRSRAMPSGRSSKLVGCWMRRGLEPRGSTRRAAMGEPLMSTRTAAMLLLVDRLVAVVEARRRLRRRGRDRRRSAARR